MTDVLCNLIDTSQILTYQKVEPLVKFTEVIIKNNT